MQSFVTPAPPAGPQAVSKAPARRPRTRSGLDKNWHGRYDAAAPKFGVEARVVVGNLEAPTTITELLQYLRAQG